MGTENSEQKESRSYEKFNQQENEKSDKNKNSASNSDPESQKGI